MPDLSRATNLKSVNLLFCKGLRELHPSILSLPKLEKLNLGSCKKIKSLKSNIDSKSLRELNLYDCSSLVEFSVVSEKMTSLNLEMTNICKVPSSIWRNSNLNFISIYVGYNVSIDANSCNGERQGFSTYLKVYGSQEIDSLKLSLLLDDIQSLENLDLRGCNNLETLPHNIHKHSELYDLVLDNCTKLVLSSPTVKLPPPLRRLSAINCTLMDTDTTRRLVFENKLLKFKNGIFDYDSYLFIPGDHDHVLGTFDFQNANGNSITIPPIPKSNLKAFMVCILLPRGFQIRKEFEFRCVIYQRGGKVYEEGIELFNRYMRLNSDHVLLWLFGYPLGNGKGYHYNLQFKFEHSNEEEDWLTEDTVGCGVHPVYALEPMLELDDKSSSSSSSKDEYWLREEIEGCELESLFQICDVDELQSQSNRGVM